MGSNLVSIFLLNRFSASSRTSAVMTATSGGGCNFRPTPSPAGPASSVVGAILSSEMCSTDALWSRSSAVVVTVIITQSARVASQPHLFTPKNKRKILRCHQLERMNRQGKESDGQDSPSNTAGPQASTYTKLACKLQLYDWG